MRPVTLLQRRLTRRQVLRAAGLGAAGAVLIATGGSNLLASLLANASGSVRRFWSRPDLTAPEFIFDVPASGTASGLLFMTPDTGPLIVDDHGEPFWIGPGSAPSRINLHATTYAGEPVLGWWEGTVTHGYGEGEYVLADTAYREITRIRAGHGLLGDLHELLVTEQGTAYITAFATVPIANRQIFEGVVQEIDIATGDVLFEWHSYPQVVESESVIGRPTDPTEIFDYFHVNSIDPDLDGNLIVSARNTSTVYKIDKATGEIIWRLGGSRSDFTIPDAVRFQLQHDARRHPDGTISIFDDDSGDRPSRGIVVRADTSTRSADLVVGRTEPSHLTTPAQGSVQLLPDGGMLVGWGNIPEMTEFAADGTIRMNAHFPSGKASYRVRRHAWTSTPAVPPAAAAHVSGGLASVYASWNGATEVASWQVFGGESSARMQLVGEAPRRGFETAVVVRAAGPWFRARALDAQGRRLADSPPVHATAPPILASASPTASA